MLVMLIPLQRDFFYRLLRSYRIKIDGGLVEYWGGLCTPTHTLPGRQARYVHTYEVDTPIGANVRTTMKMEQRFFLH